MRLLPITLVLLAACTAGPDGAAPTVTVLSPANGQVVVTETDTPIAASVYDSDAVAIWALSFAWSEATLGALEVSTRFRDDGTVEIAYPFEPGPQTVTLEVTDVDGHTGAASSTFTVERPALPDDTDTPIDTEDTEVTQDTEDSDPPSTPPSDRDGDGHLAIAAGGDDCDDLRASVQPGAAERCNERDDDCDGTIDEEPSDPQRWFADGDGDGFGDDDSPLRACKQPAGAVPNNDDCNDADGTIYPGAPEFCDGRDDDCDRDIDEDTLDPSTWYLDADADGFGDASTPISECTQPDGTSDNPSDCDDDDPTIHPEAAEICDAINQDCDAFVDEGLDIVGTWYEDLDADGFGDATLTALGCTLPATAVATAGDCDDDDAQIHPGAAETCDGIDQNCDEAIDAGATDARLWFEDADNDGYGTVGNAQRACGRPEGFTSIARDCDDDDATTHPGATESCDGRDNDCSSIVDDHVAEPMTWFTDADGDGFGDPENGRFACEPPLGTVANADDCDDTNETVHPGEAELCDGIDNNCSAEVDEAGAEGAPTWYADDDADGYGDPSTTQTGCSAPLGFIANSTDCNDADPNVRPGADERCNHADDDCDQEIDEYAIDPSTWYLDSDNDTYGNAAFEQQACWKPTGWVATANDCDDDAAAVYPGATEVIADGIDQSCDTTEACFADADGDGYRPMDIGAAVLSADLDCDDMGEGAASEPTGDCNDASDAVHPLSAETCNGIDENCNGAADEGLTTTFYRDLDADGYGDLGNAVGACAQPPNTVTIDAAGDCNDANAAAYPGAEERCNHVDDDCDALVDNDATDRSTWYRDADADLFGSFTLSQLACWKPTGWVANDDDCDDSSAAISACACNDGYDNDLDGLIDYPDDVECDSPTDTNEFGLIPQVCTYRWGMISSLTSGIRVFATDTDLILAGHYLDDTAHTEARQASTGVVRWRLEGIGANGGHNSGTSRGVFPSCAWDDFCMVAVDLAAGTTDHTVYYTPETTDWSLNNWHAVQDSGDYLVGAVNYSSTPWAITPDHPGGVRWTGGGQEAVLVRHAANGAVLGLRSIPGLRPNRDLVALGDGRWTAHLHRVWSGSLSAFGQTFAEGDAALITFSEDLSTYTVDQFGPDNLNRLDAVPNSTVRIVNTTHSIYAYDDDGTLWTRTGTCHGSVIGTTATHVYVERPAIPGQPICGRTLETTAISGNGIAILAFNVADGTLDSARWMPTSIGSNGWTGGTVSRDGDVYLFSAGDEAQLTVCGEVVDSDATYRTSILAY